MAIQLILSAYHTGVEYCLFWVRAVQSLRTGKRNAPHFLYVFAVTGARRIVLYTMLYNGLSDKDLLFGYKEIVLYYEAQVRNKGKGFNKRLLKEIFTKSEVKVRCGEDTHHSYNHLLGKEDYSFIHFSASEYSIPMLIKGLRDAYAHNRISKVHIGKRYYICFYNLYNDEYKMVGQMPFPQLRQLINTIKKTRKVTNEP